MNNQKRSNETESEREEKRRNWHKTEMKKKRVNEK